MREKPEAGCLREEITQQDKEGQEMKDRIWYTRLPAPIPPWIVKQYKGQMTEQELLRRLNEGSMECRLDPLLGDMRYSEPHPEGCWDLWINDGKTLRDQYHREGLRERAKEEVLKRRAEEWGVTGFGGVLGWFWGLTKVVMFLVMLPFEIIGWKSTAQWFLGTGEHGGGGGGFDGFGDGYGGGWC